MGTLVVREITEGQEPKVYLLDDEDYTLFEFQGWMFGIRKDGSSLAHCERDEILGYYPDVESDEMRQKYPPFHPRWWDPDGLDRRARRDWEEYQRDAKT